MTLHIMSNADSQEIKSDVNLGILNTMSFSVYSFMGDDIIEIESSYYFDDLYKVIDMAKKEGDEKISTWFCLSPENAIAFGKHLISVAELMMKAKDE